MRVMKFGGTSVGTPERVMGVAGIVEAARRQGPVAIVVSAFGGVTNDLLAGARASVNGENTDNLCEGLERRHLEAVDALAPNEERQGLADGVRERMADLRNLYRGASLVRECTARTLDAVASIGERLSAPIVAAACRRAGIDAEPCDARILVRTDDHFGQAHVVPDETYERIRAHFHNREPLQVITGFIGSTRNGDTTTLGRGGSDYTASLVGAALKASAIEIWTDVDGVMSADPRLVSRAFPLERLTYDELMELSHFGAKVVYPPTVHPARRLQIPLMIRNTLNPTFAGTRVDGVSGAQRSGLCGISSINRVALMRLEGDGMVGVPGIAMRLFGALAREGINIILISQASSEHSICFAADPGVADRARERVGEEFELERSAGLIDDLIVERDVSIIAAVGTGVRSQPEVTGKLFEVLGRQRIKVRAISQGSSELNISCAIDSADEVRALNALHDAFFPPPSRTIPISVVGTGRVGGALLRQFSENVETLEQTEGLRLVVTGLAASNRALVDGQGIDLKSWKERLTSEGPGHGIAELVDAIVKTPNQTTVFVDCTASDTVPEQYGPLLKAGMPVVAANKRAFAGSLAQYQALKPFARKGALFFETTVGAGLPVLGTLSDLVRTGDHVVRIEGVLSGTLGYIMNRLRDGAPFSAVIREAYDAGLTEPDPRDDLSGQDVARKLLILAREAGFSLDERAVLVEPLLPGPQWVSMSIDQFWQELPSLDDTFRKRVEETAGKGRRLCYIASVEPLGAQVGLAELAETHPCATLTGSDNLIAFFTARYSTTPLVVRGPGAGPEVTAAGVFADVLRAVRASFNGRT